MSQMLLFTDADLRPKEPPRERHWGFSITHPGGWGPETGIITETCRPTVQDIDYGCRHWMQRDEEPCQCVGDRYHRGACLGCDWRGPARIGEEAAVRDANDHCYPGWRELPVIVGPIPEGSGAKHAATVERFIERLESVGYPEGWIEAGGPILERRKHGGTRAHTVHTGYGNYSIAGEAVGCGTYYKRQCHGIEDCVTGRCTPWSFDREDDDD